MEIPQKVIIDLDQRKVVLESEYSVLVGKDLPKLIYCQSVNNDEINISINITVPMKTHEQKGLDEKLLKALQGITGLNNEDCHDSDMDEDDSNDEEETDDYVRISDEDGITFDFKTVDKLFEDMINSVGDDEAATKFVKYTEEGCDQEALFNYKKLLFKSDKTTDVTKKEWIRKTRIKLLNSKRYIKFDNENKGDDTL